jgi:hypothetical protein
MSANYLKPLSRLAKCDSDVLRIKMNDINELWQTHQQDRFPADYRGEEVDSVDLVMLDADIAGCVSSFISQLGILDPQQIQVLSTCTSETTRILPLIQKDAQPYFTRLRDMAQAVLNRTK